MKKKNASSQSDDSDNNKRRTLFGRSVLSVAASEISEILGPNS